MRLSGQKIAMLIAPRGTEDSEFHDPREALLAEGAEVTVIGKERGEASTVISDLEPCRNYTVDLNFEGADPADYAGLVIPGGTVGSDKLRAHKPAVEFVSKFVSQGRPVAAICHGPWLLVEAGAAQGRRMTSYPSLKTDIANAGASWVDQEVVCDRGVITSRSPSDLPAFIRAFVSEVAT